MTATETNGRPAEKVYWRSAAQLADSDEFREVLAREFPEGVAEGEGFASDVSRRGFLTAVAASVAAAGLTGCRKPKQKILPYTNRPEYMIPGVALHYATALTVDGYGVGLLVRSNDGRPTKVEGNPGHPSSLGGTTSFLQGELLNLYDPARSREPVHHQAEAESDAHAGDSHGEDHGGPSHLEQFQKFLNERGAILARERGRGLHVLIAGSSSPSQARLIDEMRSAMPEAKVHRYSPVSEENARDGARAAFGRAVDAHWSLDQCDVVMSFDCDFLGIDGDVVRNTKGYAKSRKITDEKGSVSRLYVAEGGYSVTGSNADHRFRVAPSQVPAALFALAAELGVSGGLLEQALSSYKGKQFPYKGKASWISAVAKDLRARAGRSAVMVGPRQPAAAHAVAHAINVQLGNVGKTVKFTASPAGLGSTRAIAELTDALRAGSVDTLVAIDCNPVYDAPADLKFGEALAKAKHKVHVGLHEDETSELCDWHCNLAHELESWGDVLSRDGTLTIQQPLIAPLFHGLSTVEVLARLIGSDQKDGYDIVRKTHESKASTDGFGAWWNKALHDGFVSGTTSSTENVAINAGSVAQAIGAWQAAPLPTATSLELEIRPDPTVFDGRYANNPWMQELPDPITKLTWDNAVMMSRATAEALECDLREQNIISGANVVRLKVGDTTVEGPICVVPGQADHVVTVTMGQGRRMHADCEVANNAGFDIGPLRTTKTLHSASGLTLALTNQTYELVSSQDHGSMEGRPVVREATVDEYRKDPTFAPDMSPMAQVAKTKTEHAKHLAEHAKDHGGEAKESKTYTEKDLLKSLWKERGYTKEDYPYQWGMVIDLNSCTGCNACVVACVSENNIPMVGKEQVSKGREMFWTRMDRYFTTDADTDPTTDDDPSVVHQPVPCMQCENAACESVCPVAATMHSPDGLNDMAYNRCIGTRYCANNCAYKVRRFNWFNFNLDVPDTKQMAMNPNVTVRARGVMEKCTYCVQRINHAKITANKEDRVIEDGEVTPACAQGCPADAITFGNIVDDSSRVAKLKASNLNYEMLSEMNNKPRTSYLAKIRNPNPELV